MRIYATDERSDLIPAFCIKDGPVLEIGVGDGSFSKLILDRAPQSRLIGIDPYIDPEGEIPDFYDHASNQAQARTIERQSEGKFKLVNAASPDGLTDIPDDTFSWIFVDGDHLVKGAMADLKAASRLIKPGGVIACHDFAVHDLAISNRQEVVQAVVKYLPGDPELIFYGIDLSVYPTCILVKKPTADTLAHLDERLEPWLVHTFTDLPSDLRDVTFGEILRRRGDNYIIVHTISFAEETISVETVSKRLFSGYYITEQRRIIDT